MQERASAGAGVADARPYDGAIMLTASHMPWHNNGLKFFTGGGGLGKPDIAEVLELTAAGAAEAGVALGEPCGGVVVVRWWCRAAEGTWACKCLGE